MKKVIVRLGNGLGNQLFTYAAAYSFAKKNKAQLFVDDESGFYKRYKYELHNFNITAPIIDKKYKFLGLFGRIKRKILIKFTSGKFLVEKKGDNKLTSYDSNLFNINFDKDIYFEGYFQTDKYYKENINNIINEFSFKDDVINQNPKIVNEIKKSNSVSIHLRQDKYLVDENHKHLDKLNNDFLKYNISLIEKGVKYFDKMIKDPKYFVWSNNFKDIKSHFNPKKFTIIDENINKDPAYDLYLMSLCKHFILSPSTMHYWGAFLSKNTNKICLSPPNIKNKSGYYGFSNNKDIKAEWWMEVD